MSLTSLDYFACLDPLRSRLTALRVQILGTQKLRPAQRCTSMALVLVVFREFEFPTLSWDAKVLP